MFLFLVKQLHSWSYCNLSTVPTKLTVIPVIVCLQNKQ